MGAWFPLKNTNEKILVVDDDQAIRWALSEALRSWSFEPIEAGTVAEALAQFSAESPAAVLLDIDLPDGSGLADKPVHETHEAARNSDLFSCRFVCFVDRSRFSRLLISQTLRKTASSNKLA